MYLVHCCYMFAIYLVHFLITRNLQGGAIDRRRRRGARGGKGGGQTGVGTHQDTIQSPRRLYKAPIYQILTISNKQKHKLTFFQKGMSKKNKENLRPTATSTHGWG